jgi:SAM-dependent methyltransferase
VKRLAAACLLILAIFAGYGLSTAVSVWRSQTIQTVRSWRSRAIIGHYLESHQTRKLQLGAGQINMDEWLNTDIEPGPQQAFLDATKPFPLPDRSINYIFGEHVIEHVVYNDGLAMLRECHRVLVPGGKVRFATPDLRRFAALMEGAPAAYVNAKLEFHEWRIPPELAPPFIINEEIRNFGHRFVYDEITLRDSLAKAGFTSVQRFDPGASDDNALVGIEARHNNPKTRAMNDYETMVLQATR